jgi:hypothetical protein
MMRYRFGFLGAALVALAGCDAPPEGTSVEDIANYQAAVASIGCEMRGESDYLPVEFQAGLTRDQTVALTAYHIATEQAVKMEDGTVRLTVGGCAPAA